MTHPAAVRAEFEALCDDVRQCWINCTTSHSVRARNRAERKYDTACVKLVAFCLVYEDTIHFLATPEPPATLPDDWRPRPDADGD